MQQDLLATNVGKGSALRAGLGMGRGRYLGFIDADGDISPEFLGDFVSIMRSEKPDIIIGSKRHPDSSVHTIRHTHTLAKLRGQLERGMMVVYVSACTAATYFQLQQPILKTVGNRAQAAKR